MTLTQLGREIKEIKSILESNDMISEKEAAALLGMKLSSLKSRISEKKLEGYYILGALGRRFFYRSKLVGLKV